MWGTAVAVGSYHLMELQIASNPADSRRVIRDADALRLEPVQRGEPA